MRLLSHLLTRFIRNGAMRLYEPSGALHTFGTGGEEPIVTVRLNDPKLPGKLFRNPELNAAEAYMDGTLTFEDGSTCHDFLYLFSINRSGLGSHPAQRALRTAWRRLRALQQYIALPRMPSITTTSQPTSTGCFSTTT